MSLALDTYNLLVGFNGSGKTSVLEALYLLAYGKSFRTHITEQIIQSSESDVLVSGRFGNHQAGIQRFRNGSLTIRLDGQDVTKISEVSRLLPMHVVDPGSVVLVEGSPSDRRRFLDFTMFHVEHSYLAMHRRFTDILRQRNALLKTTASTGVSQIKYWNGLYVEAAWDLHRVRENLFADVIAPVIVSACHSLLEGLDISIEYYSGCRGCSSVEALQETMEKNIEQDLKFKATQIGPHRADILLKHNGKPAKDYLSRGQKKLLTYGVRLAPAMMLKDRGLPIGQILVDDMPSELDEHSVAKVCDLLARIDGQTILTAVDDQSRQVNIIRDRLQPKMFHVEHGSVLDKNDKPIQGH